MIGKAEHIGIGIDCPLDQAYAFLADPENFPAWASGLGKEFRHVEGMRWRVDTPMGEMVVEFSARNAFGVLDHTLLPNEGAPMHNPLRVIRNGDGCEVIFTLFQRPEMTDADMQRDAEWVRGDLAKLKMLLEARRGE